MAVIGWKWLKIDLIGWKGLEIDENDWNLQETARHDSKWMNTPLYPKMAGNGWK